MVASAVKLTPREEYFATTTFGAYSEQVRSAVQAPEASGEMFAENWQDWRGWRSGRPPFPRNSLYAEKQYAYGLATGRYSSQYPPHQSRPKSGNPAPSVGVSRTNVHRYTYGKGTSWATVAPSWSESLGF